MQSDTRRTLAVLGIPAIVAILLAAAAVWAQIPAATGKYVPSELQLLRLQVKQRDAQMAQQRLQLADQQFRGALAAFEAEAEKVKADNKWAPTVQFNPDTLTFDDAPAAPTPAAKPPIGPPQPTAPAPAPKTPAR